MENTFKDFINLIFKGVISFNLSCLNKYVLEVRVHIRPLIKNPLSGFKIPFLKSGCSEVPVRLT